LILSKIVLLRAFLFQSFYGLSSDRRAQLCSLSTVSSFFCRLQLIFGSASLWVLVITYPTKSIIQES